MSLIVLLDAGPLGMITNPKSSPENEACKNWLASLAPNSSSSERKRIAHGVSRGEAARSRSPGTGRENATAPSFAPRAAPRAPPSPSPPAPPCPAVRKAGQEARPTGLVLSGAGRGTHAVCGSACLLGVTRRVVSACSPGLRHGLGRACPALPRLTPWATVFGPSGWRSVLAHFQVGNHVPLNGAYEEFSFSRTAVIGVRRVKSGSISAA